MINFHRRRVTAYTKCRSYPMLVLMSCVGIGTLYPVFFAALAPLSYISYLKMKNHPNVEAKYNYLLLIEENRLQITLYHSWTENIWQLLLQIDDLSGKVDNIISILISFVSICYSFSEFVNHRLRVCDDSGKNEMFG